MCPICQANLHGLNKKAAFFVVVLQGYGDISIFNIIIVWRLWYFTSKLFSVLFGDNELNQNDGKFSVFSSINI